MSLRAIGVNFGYLCWLFCIPSFSFSNSYFRGQAKPDIEVVGLDYDESAKYINISGEERKTIYLWCKVKQYNAKISFKWTWKRDGKEISKPIPYVIKWKNGSVLMVRPLLEKYTHGKYECIAEYKQTRVTGKMYINVIKHSNLPSGFPYIKTHPTDVRTRRLSVDFHCMVSGEAPMRIIWYRNRNPISSDGNYQISVGYRNNVLSSNLRIRNTKGMSGSFYQCVAMNRLGQVVSNDAQILFGKQRRKRSYNVKVPNKCETDINTTHSSDPVKNIRKQCVEVIGKPFFSFSWDLPKNFQRTRYYQVKISAIGSGPYLKCFKTKGNTFYYNQSIGMDPNASYEISVDTLPSSQVETPVTKVGSCPVIGVWSKWEEWSECNCKCGQEEGCYGKRNRHRYCVHKDDLITTLYDEECQEEDNTDNERECYNDCKEFQLLTICKSRRKTKYIEIVCGGIIGGIILIVILILTIRNCRRSQESEENKRLINYTGATSVYVSYLTEAEDEKRLLSLIHFISHYNVDCIVDILRQVEINNAGGLPNWIPQNITNADKILVILSKPYIKAINSIEEKLETFSDKVCKIHTEINLIKSILFRSCQRTQQLVLLLDDHVKKEDIPELFRERNHCVFPKKLDYDDEGCRKIMGLLLDTEPLQISHNI